MLRGLLRTSLERQQVRPAAGGHPLAPQRAVLAAQQQCGPA